MAGTQQLSVSINLFTGNNQILTGDRSHNLGGFIFALNNGSVVFNGSSLIGSEDISLQGHTTIVGNSTSSADTALEILDNTNAELFDFRNDGKIVASQININGFNNNTNNKFTNVLIGNSANIGTVAGNYNNAIAIGNGASARSTNAIAILGIASTNGSVAIGSNAFGKLSIAIGNNNVSSDDRTIAIGKDNTATRDFAIAIGSSSQADAVSSIAIGDDSHATGSRTMTLGENNRIGGSYSIGIGYQLNSQSFSDTIIFGRGVANTPGNYLEPDGNNQFVVGFGGVTTPHVHWRLNGVSYFNLGTGSYVFGGSTPINTEKISLQGETYIKRNSISGSDTVAALLDSADVKLWDWKANGDIYQGADSIHYLNGNDLTISKQPSVTQTLKIEQEGNFSEGWRLYNINGVVDECYGNLTTGQVGFDGTELSHNIVNGTTTYKGALKALNNGFRFDVTTIGSTYSKRLTHRYSESLGGTNTVIDFHYKHIPSFGFIQSLNISGTYTANDYISIRTNLNYIFDVNNLIGYNVGIGTGANPAAKLTVNGDFIANGTSKIASEDISLQGDTLIDGTLDMNNNRITKTIVNPTVQETTSTATLTINANQENKGVLTAQAVALTVANPTGAAVQGQKLVYRIKDNGTARAITWGANFRAIGVTLPTTTTASKLLYVGCIYNTTDSKWDVVAVNEEA